MDRYLTNPIIKALVDRDISVEITKEGFKIRGFYKSGEILLRPAEGDTFIAVARYNEEDEIGEFDDLVRLNYYWWDRSKDRYEGWTNPEEDWIPDLERLGYIKKEIKTVTKYYSLK